jgi:hypothetical protein
MRKILKSGLSLFVVLFILLSTVHPMFVFADEPFTALDTVPAIKTNVGTPVISPDYVKTYPFDVIIPVFSYAYSDGPYTMTPGKYVQAHLTNSGGHNVYMTVVDYYTNQPLGDEVAFTQEGITKTLWTNTTGTTKYVKIRFGAAVPFNVHATGSLIFGWF